MFILNSLFGLIKFVVLLPLKILQFLWQVPRRILGWIIFFIRLFLGRSEEVTGGTNFLLVVTIGLFSFGVWAATSEFDRVITAQS
jgi:hypothetical protein